MNKDTLIQELKEMIVEVCNLVEVGVDVDSIGNDDILIDPNGAIGLDSLDAVEIVAAVEKRYGVRVSNTNTSLKVLQSVSTLADYILENGK